MHDSSANTEGSSDETPRLAPEDRQRMLFEWNSTHAIYPQCCVHQLFEHQVVATPDAIAVSFEEKQVSYRSLNDLANLVAASLRQSGVGPEVLVAICIDRSVGMVAALLGVLKAGGAYLPMDPSYPKDRLNFMLEDSKATTLLTAEAYKGLFDLRNVQTICFDGDKITQDADTPRHDSGAHAADPKNLAYVIYTSGSTGKPKGVQITHSALVNLLATMQSRPGLTAEDVLLAVTTISFDIAALEIFLPLSVGAQVVLTSRETASSPAALITKMESCGATIMQATPATWRLLVESGWRPPSSLSILCGGEALPWNLAEKLLEGGAALWNLYGPTETTIWSTIHRVESDAPECRGSGATVPIGRPVANTQIYILDEQMQPVPAGMLGELYIGGDGVARGFLNRPDLTSNRFVANPFSEDPASRLYRTGDLAKYGRNGLLEFHGRMDQQVKIRGFRVELEEIEAVLVRHPCISQSVVAATDDRGLGRGLIAYLVLHQGAKITGGQIRDFLKRTLPDYMVPSYFVILDSLPLTQNGKTDRIALPRPGEESFRQLRSIDVDAAFVPPVTKLQAELIHIWQEVLDVRPIGIHQDFFELGGHSLMAAMVSREVSKRLGRQLSLASIFRSPTVEALAIAMSTEENEDDSVLEVIREKGSSMPFFCIPGLLDLSRHMGSDQPCYGLNLPALDESRKDWPAIEQIAAGCIKAIRSVQPKGPYSIGGFSFGSVVAYEIAQQLNALGETLTSLVLLDPDPPKPFRTSGVDFYISRVIFHGRKLAALGLRQRLGYLVKRMRASRSRVAHSVWNTGNSAAELTDYLRRTETIHARYAASRYSGRVFMLLASDTVWRVQPEKDPRLDWKRFIDGDLEIYETPGDHQTVIREPNVRQLAQLVGNCLNRACNVTALAICLSAIFQ